MLLKEVKEKDKGMLEFKKLQKAYLTGDLVTAEKLNTGDDSMTPAERSKLIDQRNNNWMKLLPSLMKEQSCFICVGFLHLVGPNGLVSQLKTAGYDVVPVAL